MTLKFTTHVLNGTDGTHAAGVDLSICNRGDGTVLFSGETDAGGRLQAEIPSAEIAPEGQIELVIVNGAFWETRNIPRTRAKSSMKLQSGSPCRLGRAITTCR